MTIVKFRSNFDVQIIDTMGDDHRIIQAAKVSTLGADSINAEDSDGLIRYLMTNRHGSPFEHCLMQWMITAPIFVWREFHRHRVASYNEQSSRYMQLEPVFYVPETHTRPTHQDGKPGHYKLTTATPRNTGRAFERSVVNICQSAYEAYEAALTEGIAREVARQLLPVAIYSTCYVTMNVRALMNFLSLRMDGTALWEIRQVANMMYSDFEEAFPKTAEAFFQFGMVAP